MNNIFHMKLNLLIHQTEKKNTGSNDIEREENEIWEQNEEISSEESILGDSMTKLLNGWKMEKSIQSNCKIYVKIFIQINSVMYVDYMVWNSP